MATNPLINRDFALLAIGQFTSMVGDSIHQVALVWWLYNVTGSPGTTGLLTMAAMVPALILGPYMGVLADRLDRRKLVYSLDFARAAVIGTVALLAFTEKLEIWHVVLSSAVIGVIGSLFSPAATAMIPGLVGLDNLQRAHSLSHGMSGLVGIFGPALGGILVSSFGYATSFFINATALFLSGVSEIFIRYERQQRDIRETGIDELKKAVRFAFSMPTLLGILLIFGVMNFALAPMSSVTVPYIIKDRLGYGATELGLVMTFISVGGIAASLVMGLIKNPKRRSGMMVLAGLCIGASLLSWLVMPTLRWFYAICTISGFMMVVININAGVLLMTIAPDDMRGKMTAFTHFVVSFMSPVSLAAFSLIAKQNAGIVFYYPAVTGLMIAACSLCLLLVKGFRQL